MVFNVLRQGSEETMDFHAAVFDQSEIIVLLVMERTRLEHPTHFECLLMALRQAEISKKTIK